MRTSQRDYQTLGDGPSKSTFRKENIPHLGSPSTPSAVISFSTLSPNSPTHSRILQHQWANATVQPFVNRGNSPKPVLQSTHPRVIQLGGSKQKRMSRQKAVSHCSSQTQGNEGTSNQSLGRKVAMLENRVKELHVEKQHLAVELNQRLRGLEMENERLIMIIKDSQKGKTSTSDGEFDFEEELSNQININLELREQLQKLNLELKATKQREVQLTTELSNLGEEKADLKLQLLQLQDSSNDQANALKEQLKLLQQSIDRKDSNFTLILQDKEKRILELEEQAFSLQSNLGQKDRQNGRLRQELTSLQREQATAKQEALFLHRRVSELEKPVECKKCKDLLHTVFRLNSQLNKKQS